MNEVIRDIAINRAVRALNNEYGTGTLIAIRRFADGRLEATFRPFGLADVVRKGRLVGGRSVRMFGHQRVLKGYRE
jgi:hypothetical protein